HLSSGNRGGSRHGVPPRRTGALYPLRSSAQDGVFTRDRAQGHADVAVVGRRLSPIDRSRRNQPRAPSYRKSTAVARCTFVTATRSSTLMNSSGAAMLFGRGPKMSVGTPLGRKYRASVAANVTVSCGSLPVAAATLARARRTSGSAGDV